MTSWKNHIPCSCFTITTSIQQPGGIYFVTLTPLYMSLLCCERENLASERELSIVIKRLSLLLRYCGVLYHGVSSYFLCSVSYFLSFSHTTLAFSIKTTISMMTKMAMKLCSLELGSPAYFNLPVKREKRNGSAFFGPYSFFVKTLTIKPKSKKHCIQKNQFLYLVYLSSDGLEDLLHSYVFLNQDSGYYQHKYCLQDWNSCACGVIESIKNIF